MPSNVKRTAKTFLFTFKTRDGRTGQTTVYAWNRRGAFKSFYATRLRSQVKNVTAQEPRLTR